MKKKYYIVGSIVFFCSLTILTSCSNSFKKEALSVAGILCEAYKLEESGSAKEGIAKDGNSKIIFIPSNVTKSKQYLISKSRNIDQLFQKINLNIANKNSDDYFNAVFLETIINLDYYYLTGSFFDENYDTKRTISKSELQNVSAWVLDSFYSGRMPQILKEEWTGMDKQKKIDAVYKFISFIEKEI